MQIQVVGSWLEYTRRWKLIGGKNEFQGVCSTIGRVIALKGYTLNISSLDPRTADYWAAKGYISAINTGNRDSIGKIIVYASKNKLDLIHQSDIFKDYPYIFSFKIFNSFWESMLNSTQDSNMTIIIGGTKGTFLVGLIAIMMNKKLIPITSFGGASLEIAQMKYMGAGMKIITQFAINSEDLSNNIIQLISPKVFIIHGRDEDWKKLKHFLNNAGVNVLVLEEQFMGGLTIPEKLEYIASQSDFAIALVTPDDIGSLRNSNNFEYRARQNVMLEIGWFWGKLGRERIIILQKRGTKIPSDLQGIEVIKYDKLNKNILNWIYKKLVKFGIL